MMPDDPVTIPEHYKSLAREMKQMSLSIRDAFAERPLPQGLPWKMPDDIVRFCDDLKGSVERLAICINTLPGCSAQYIPRENINIAMSEAISRLDLEVQGLITLYYKLWQRPFPADYIDGQPIVSEMYENIMRDCLILFGKVVDLVELPPEQIPAKYGSTNVSLSHSFTPAVADRILFWLDNRAEMNNRKKAPSWTLLGFLFGWFWGHRD